MPITSELCCRFISIRSCILNFLIVSFWMNVMTFLGHVVSSDGIKVELQKVETVKKCPRTMTPTDIRNFLGLAGYDKRFVESFSFIAGPLMRLT